MILSAFKNRLRASSVQHTMQTSPAVEQNKNIKWSESPWNQSGMKGKCLWRKCTRCKARGACILQSCLSYVAVTHSAKRERFQSLMWTLFTRLPLYASAQQQTAEDWKCCCPSSVRCPWTPIPREAISLQLVKEFHWNLARIFITWVVIAEKVFNVKKSKVKPISDIRLRNVLRILQFVFVHARGSHRLCTNV